MVKLHLPSWDSAFWDIIYLSICPSLTVSLSSSCFLFKYDSVSASSSHILMFHAPFLQPITTILDRIISCLPIGPSIIHHHYCLDSGGDFFSAAALPNWLRPLKNHAVKSKFCQVTFYFICYLSVVHLFSPDWTVQHWKHSAATLTLPTPHPWTAGHHPIKLSNQRSFFRKWLSSKPHHLVHFKSEAPNRWAMSLCNIHPVHFYIQYKLNLPQILAFWFLLLNSLHWLKINYQLTFISLGPFNFRIINIESPN